MQKLHKKYMYSNKLTQVIGAIMDATLIANLRAAKKQNRVHKTKHGEASRNGWRNWHGINNGYYYYLADTYINHHKLTSCRRKILEKMKCAQTRRNQVAKHSKVLHLDYYYIIYTAIEMQER
jgi:hypothetical protein